MNIGIEIHFNDEFKAREWIDSVDENEFDIMLTLANDVYEIDNGHHIYQFDKADIKEFIKYELFECCGFDVRYEYHSIECENGD